VVLKLKGVWLWVWFYPELLVPEIWFLRLAGMQVYGFAFVSGIHVKDGSYKCY